MGGLIGVAIMAIICMVVGKSIEKNHYKSVEAREKKLSHILVFNEKTPAASLAGQNFYLVSGGIVTSSDYFKQIVAGLKQMFGGRLNSYEAMMDLGRREAILRMKEDAARKGATIIFNVHLQTATLNQNDGQKKIFCAELFAYGTAWGPRR